MYLVNETFLVAPVIEDRLKDVAALKGEGIVYPKVAIQCIDLLHSLNAHWRAGRQMYKENEPLYLPPPLAVGVEPIHEIKLRIYYPQQVSFTQICRNNDIDKQSAISWALDCMQVIDEALMTHRLFARKDQLWYPFEVGWIHKQKSP